ncbi:MAG: hypothetical protein ABEH47_03170 [Haloferacaceae archaeon]
MTRDGETRDDAAPTAGDPGDAAAEDALADLLAAVHDHLAATAERPVSREASRWLGEAEAVAADVATGDPPPAATERRLDDLDRLLGEVDGTGDPAADDRVAAARDALAAARDRFETRDDHDAD